MWHVLDIIFQMLDKDIWTNTNKKIFQTTLDLFKKEFVKAWEDINFRHYMVREVLYYIHGSIKLFMSTI